MEGLGQEKSLPESSVILADETTPGEALDKRLERYAKAKKRSRSVMDYIIHLMDESTQSEISNEEYWELEKIYDQMDECGAFLLFRHFYTKGIHKLVGGCTCKRHLLCMLCAIRRGAKQMEAYQKKVEQVLSGNENQKLALITLTVKNGNDLLERYTHLTKSLKVLTDRRKFMLSGKKPIPTVFADIQGAVWTFEATNTGNGWHPHCHMLAIVDRDIDLGEMELIDGSWVKSRVGRFQNELTQEWQGVTGDSFIVDVRPIVEKSDTENMTGAFREVFKYALKTNDMTVENQYQAYKSLKGKRLIASLGSLYNVQVSGDLNDTVEEELRLSPYIDILFRYSETFGYQEYENSSSRTDRGVVEEETNRSKRAKVLRTKLCQVD